MHKRFFNHICLIHSFLSKIDWVQFNGDKISMFLSQLYNVHCQKAVTRVLDIWYSGIIYRLTVFYWLKCYTGIWGQLDSKVVDRYSNCIVVRTIVTKVLRDFFPLNITANLFDYLQIMHAKLLPKQFPKM